MTAPGSPSGSDPYLHIVLTGRNDNFGCDFNEAIQPALWAGAHSRASQKTNLRLRRHSYIPRHGIADSCLSVSTGRR